MFSCKYWPEFTNLVRSRLLKCLSVCYFPWPQQNCSESLLTSTIVSAPRKLHKRLQLIEVQVERTILISIIFSHSNVKQTANQCASTSNDIVRSQHSCTRTVIEASCMCFHCWRFETFYCMLTSHTRTRNVAWNFHGFIDCYIYK